MLSVGWASGRCLRLERCVLEDALELSSHYQLSLHQFVVRFINRQPTPQPTGLLLFAFLQTELSLC